MRFIVACTITDNVPDDRDRVLCLADAKQLLLCIYLSGTVLIGLLLNSLFGWMWADSVAALVVAVLATREGIEAWLGDMESPFEVLEDLNRDDDQDTAEAIT